MRQLLKSARDVPQPLEIGTCIGHGWGHRTTPGIFVGPKRLSLEPRFQGGTSSSQKRNPFSDFWLESEHFFEMLIRFNTSILYSIGVKKNECTNIKYMITTYNNSGKERCQKSPQLLPKCLKTSAEVLCKAGLRKARVPNCRTGGSCVVSPWFLIQTNTNLAILLVTFFGMVQNCDPKSKVVGDLQRLGIRRSL